ncbi:hypothetical protein BX616_003197 [Lobosporangium transversale]|nr:hypothetical protein BX616_003197 [Lobosporangium transversale]
MSTYNHNNETTLEYPQGAGPTRAYLPPSKSTPLSSGLSAALTEKLAVTLGSKKAYMNLPSIQKVIASHSNIKTEETDAPGYDETIANIPDLDLLPPPPVYDIVNCPTSQTLLLVSSLINTILAVNDRLACPKITLFHSRAIPNISIEAYLSRILKYATFQNEVLLIILLYFDRIGGGCKPTQVLTNSFPKSLLRQASMTKEDINQLMSPGGGHEGNMDQARDEKAALSRQGNDTTGTDADADSDTTDEEEAIADEIYTSSSDSPVGSKLIINSFNIHRLLITSIVVASKFSSDRFCPNGQYAKVGGLPLKELNQLELEFLFLSQFELNTTEAELQSYGNKLLMYHQRLNGMERAAIDAITPAKGEYIRLNEKKHIVHEKPIPSRIQTSIHPHPQHRPPSEMDHRPFISPGPYRDSKEIIDDDEVMSEKADDQIGSPTDWKSGASTPVVAEAPIAKYPTQRSNKMNLDHMIWPTNDVDIKYTPGSYYGAMEKDEDAARIEEEFKKASPPPESDEPNPKRKLQRLSSGTMESIPAKRVNTPGKGTNSEKSSSQPGSNKNILKPFFRKIASLANRSDAAPTPEPEPSPQPPSLRSHPYLVRYRVSPASSSTNLAESEMITPTTPTSSRTMNWQPDDYPSQQTRVSSAFQMKPPPPPYSGQDQEADLERQPRPMATGPSRRRQHRSREPSLSLLASELSFEPRSSLSPMHEETKPDAEMTHPATLAPLYFPPRPQTVQSGPQTMQQPLYAHPHAYSSEPIQGYSTPPTTPMRKERSASDARGMKEYPFEHQPTSTAASSHSIPMVASPSSEVDDNAMQCDEESMASVSPTSVATATTKRFHSAPVVSVSDPPQEKYKMSAPERIETGKPNADMSSSASAASPSPSSAHSSHSQRESVENEAIAGRHWIPRHAPAPPHPSVQYPHSHYVASYYPASNVQLLQNPAAATAVGPRPVMMIPRNPQTLPGLSSNSNSSPNKIPQTSVAARPARQFAPIRPRTPTTNDEDSKGRVVPAATETVPSPSTTTASSATAASASSQKKKKNSVSSESKSKAQYPPPPLRPLVPTVMATAAPPPYRPPQFIAYPAPYGPQLRAPDGTPIRSPAPIMMAVDYPPGALAGHGHQFIAAAPQTPGGGPAPTRLYIPVIPVMYNKAPVAAAPIIGSSSSGKAPGKPNTPAKIAPRIHRP